MANLKPVFATETTADTITNSLAAGATDTGTEIDNSTTRYLDGRFDVELAASAAETGVVTIYLLEGSTTAKLSTALPISDMRRIGDVQMNGTTVVRKSIFVQNLPEFFSTHAINNGAVALAASANTIKFTGINYENV